MVVLLGGFHTRMNFLGCIGYLMSNTGLEQVLEQIYAPGSVKHIMSGKAVSRAIRAHTIIDLALHALLFTCSDGKYNQYFDECRNWYEQLSDNSTSAQDIESSEIFSKLSLILEEQRNELKDCRTAKLWFQYIDMISILKQNIKAERTGNWALYLTTLTEMLPYFAACSHNNYTKSIRIHLQNMESLKEHNNDLYNKFQDGLFVVRRSDKSWAGLAPDLVIEQALMRSLKSISGLTHGKGMGEIQRIIWTQSMPTCAQINESMQDIVGLKYATSDQHIDSSKARINKDTNDTGTVIQFLQVLEPFNKDNSLHNIVTGVNAPVSVNVDNAKHVGMKILDDMTDKLVSDYVFRKKEKVVNMETQKALKIGDDEILIDHALLFQRFSVISARECSNMEDAFSFELSTFPPALFSAPEILRPANKAALADAIEKKSLQHAQSAVVTEYDDKSYQHIIDGGWLLHKIPWQKNSTYSFIGDAYVTYVLKHFGKAYVVFDGYNENPSTKDMMHIKRTKGLQYPVINFTDTMKLCVRKDEFLRNSKNKERIIQYIGNKLSLAGCTVAYAQNDADVLITKTAATVSKASPSCVVGNDTDLLILLLYYCDNNSFSLYYNTGTKIWNINVLRDQFGSLCDSILFIHAFLGCDTTSSFYGIGKQVALSLYQSNTKFQQSAIQFSEPEVSKETIIQAGEQATLCIYKAKNNENLISLRHRLFESKVTSSASFVSPEKLPPTPAAAKYHYFRVYLQIMQWKDMAEQMLCEDWGWHLVNGKYIPIMTGKSPAPDNILKIIRCGCKSGCNNLRCSCRKNGLMCTAACNPCAEQEYSNKQIINIDFDM